MSLSELIERAKDGFDRHFGGEPDCISIAPGRTNLIGEHTDYHDGFVFPAAIDRYIAVAARRSKNETSKVVSDGFTAGPSFNLMVELPDVKWLRYALGTGVLWRDAGYQVPPIEAYSVTTVPVGAGLSSSAATEVAFAKVLESWMGLGLSKPDLARWCQKSENEVCGVPCGIMDQTASLCGEQGSALFIDTRTLEVKPVKLPDGLSIVICDTGTHHSLGDSGYPLRRRQSEAAAEKLGFKVLRDATMEMLEKAKDMMPEVEFRRARHIITENARCEAFAEALSHNDLHQIGLLMLQSHDSMRDDYEITTPLIDQTAEFCRNEPGCVGARMTGGGFGGAVVALVENAKVESFSRYVTGFFRKAEAKRGKVFPCAASQGAWIEK